MLLILLFENMGTNFVILCCICKPSPFYFPAPFPITLSMMSAMAPSPVTLQAVPKLSIAMYSAIISACADSSKPSIDCRIPSAAMMAPPGTPGAATIVIPSRQTAGSRTAFPASSSVPVRRLRFSVCCPTDG